MRLRWNNRYIKGTDTKQNRLQEQKLIQSIEFIPTIKRATRCTEAPAYAGSGKGSHHLVYCTKITIELLKLRSKIDHRPSIEQIARIITDTINRIYINDRAIKITISNKS